MNAVETPARMRLPIFLFGVACYVLFLGTFLYAIGFIGNLVVPKSIDSGEVGSLPAAMAINAALLSLFVIQHTVMARPAFKRWWTTIVPRPAERSIFVLATCCVLILTFWLWQPMPEVVWHVENATGRAVLYGLFALGWVIVLYSSFCIDHFDLFGLRQVVLHLRGREYTSAPFVMPWLYKLVRNPLMLGFLIAFWSAPTMSQGRLLFAILTTGYILMGIQFEERDLLRHLGEQYREYRQRTPMLLPVPRRKSREARQFDTDTR